MKVGISLIIVAVLAIAISRRIRLSPRYDRVPRKLTQWNSMDKGIDPTEDQS
ncbi:hypothetical protein [Candidatus Planktophila dulcis]|jgi:uncharacterized protein YhdP|uniref:hypothetical protein n=1 Tax=Candidatus Planktophila dulcis TaxID=1884914 RepID=UPI001681ACE8|nr:hypothetical protein [Candidatus Planktophila dulcis]